MQRTFTVVKTVERSLAEALPEVAEFVGQEIELIVVRPAGATAVATPLPRRAGFLKGNLKMGDDFDAPLEDFKDYM